MTGLIQIISQLWVWFALQTVVLLAVLWMLFGRAFRSNPPGFIWRTFMDDRGVPDGKILAVCHTLVVMTITMAVGWIGTLLKISNPWPPFYVWASWDFIAIAGIFGTVYATKKYYEAGGAAAAKPDQLPGSAAASVAEEPTPSFTAE